MNKYIVLSVNDNPDYLYYVPLTCWAWRKFGWEPVVLYTRTDPRSKLTIEIESIISDDDTSIPAKITRADRLKPFRSDTITQVSRLYAAACNFAGHFVEGASMEAARTYLMTGDIDMIPLSDYWEPDPTRITVYGHDLTGKTHYPICYIGMEVDKWRKVMNIKEGDDYNTLILQSLYKHDRARSGKFEDYWFTDQELITQKLQDHKHEIDFINRGQYSNGYAYGRVDRGAWTLDHKEFIDAHLFHQIYHKGREEYFDKTMELLCKIWPDQDWQWFCDYHYEFKKLTGHA